MGEGEKEENMAPKKKTPAKKSPPKKTPAKKTPVKKTIAKKTPAKSPAQEKRKREAPPAPAPKAKAAKTSAKASPKPVAKKTPVKKAKKSPMKKKVTRSEPETSSGSLWEKKALKTTGKRSRIMSRLMTDDSFFMGDSLPPQETRRKIPAKPAAKKAPAPKPTPPSGPSKAEVKATNTAIVKIVDLGKALVKKYDKKKAQEIVKLAQNATLG